MTASGGAGAPGSAEEARRQAESGAKEAEEQLHRGAERAREAAHDLKAETKRAASDVLDEASEKVRSVVDQQRRSAAEEIADIAHALRSGADDLEAHDKAYIARHVDAVAGGIDRIAGNLRDQDLGALLGQVQDFARRQPGLFLGGMFATGFALARFVKSSAERDEPGAGEPTRGAGATAQPGGPGPGPTSPGAGPDQWGQPGPHTSPGAGPDQWGRPAAPHGGQPTEGHQADQRSAQEGSHGNR